MRFVSDAAKSAASTAKHAIDLVETQSEIRQPQNVPTMTRKRSRKTPLTGRVALVAGATRGAGRGIARALAEAGATVYCTGRSVTGKLSLYGRPETINETATLIKAAGGDAIAVRVDHTSEREVTALFRRILRTHHRVDIVVDMQSNTFEVVFEDPERAILAYKRWDEGGGIVVVVATSQHSPGRFRSELAGRWRLARIPLQLRPGRSGRHAATLLAESDVKIYIKR